ncbi:hypothetical protein [Kribbella sp. NPDC004536]|uniref:hypothetical protein n=1 Tax=Kribbella sp. NPDC004536 TaxID=3364106 RepID=UPI0036984B1D
MSQTLPNTEKLMSKCDACGAPCPDGRRLCGNPENEFCAAEETYPLGYDLGVEEGWRMREAELDGLEDAMGKLIAEMGRLLADLRAGQ